MNNCDSKTESGFNHILEEMFQYYVKSIITNYEHMQSSVYHLRSHVFSHVVASLCDISWLSQYGEHIPGLA